MEPCPWLTMDAVWNCIHSLLWIETKLETKPCLWRTMDVMWSCIPSKLRIET